VGGRVKKKACWLIGCIFLVLAFALSLRFGSSNLSWKQFFMGIAGREGYEKTTFILLNLRLPRAVSAVLAGIGLSISGVALQNITGNDLAGPNIIGVNAGAGFFVILGMYLLPGCARLFPAFAFLGAFLTSLVILLIGNAVPGGKNTMILAGIAITALLNAGISLISLIDTDILAAYTDFSVGGLSGSGTNALLVPSFMIFASGAIMLLFSKDVDAVTLGDGIANSIGVNVRLVRFFVILAASAAAGAVVSFAGLLGFVGLIVPHIAKRIFGIRTRTAILGSSLTGAAIVLIADGIGRTIFPGTEVPVGIVMAFVGAPFFVYLIFRRKAT